MPIYFRTYPREFPITLESIGNRWNQEDIRRQNGYPCYHWLMTEKGCGQVEVNGETILLKEGCGILIAPFVPHRYYRQSTVWETAFATFSGSLEGNLEKIVGKWPVIYVHEHSIEPFRIWIDETVARYSGNQQPEPVQLSVDCYAFLLHLACLQERSEKEDQPLFTQYVQPVIAQIEDSFSQPVTVQDLARSVYISPQYLSRLFNRFLGCSAYAYLTGYRIRKAKEILISRPHLGVQHIANMTGYLDASHFIVMFKKVTGYTPLEFRKTYMLGAFPEDDMDGGKTS